MLVPDIPLGQALGVANSVNCLILPAPLAALQQFSYDPRLAELLGLVSQNQARVVAAAQSPGAAAHRPSSLLSALEPLLYPETSELAAFISATLAPLLSSEAAPLQNEPLHLNGKKPHLNGKR